jgi:hypothetical protein
MSFDLITGVIAFLFTLMILSYLIGDSPVYRVASYIFVGISAGYAAAVALRQVLWPDLILPIAGGAPTSERALLAVPLFLSGLLLMKAWPPLSRLGAPALGLLIGASAAVAVGGAVNGTLFPQVSATINLFPQSFFDGVLISMGVIATLAYFHFGARTDENGIVRRFSVLEALAFVGSIFLAITLGVLFAGVYSAALTAMIERLHFLGTFFGLG